MPIKQISIFVENKPGRLADITSLVAEKGIDIRALSIADTTDYGILRLIVNDPEKAEAALKDSGLTVSMTNVLGIGIPDEPGGFSRAIRVLADAGISVEYAYAFITPEVGAAYVIIRVENNEDATAVLTKAGIKLIEQNEIFALNVWSKTGSSRSIDADSRFLIYFTFLVNHMKAQRLVIGVFPGF